MKPTNDNSPDMQLSFTSHSNYLKPGMNDTVQSLKL